MKVAVVSRVRLYREGLELVLGGRADVEVAGTAGDASAATRLVAATMPAVAIVDAGLIRETGLLPALTRAHPAIRVVAFAVRDDPAEIIACAEGGVAGYVSTDACADDLVAVLVAAEHGEVQCTPFVAGALLRRVTELSGGSAGRPKTALTSREAEVLALLTQGLMNKQIARRLGISLSTVKNHVHRILQKQEAFSRIDLISPAGR